MAVRQRRRTRHLLLCGAFLAGCCGPAAQAWGQIRADAPALPVLGDAARGDLSPVMERKLGEEIMRDIRRDIDFLDDAPILEYLNTFGSGLVASHPGARGETNADYYFFAVRDSQLNAFALPGGFIGVHSALLLAAQTESELASVLGHEVGHVAQRHIARMIGQQKQDALIPLAAMVLAALAARGSGDAAMGVMAGGQGLAIQRQLNFTREAEREADRVGFQIMSEGGYDTSGMVAFFGRLQTASRAYSDLMPASLRSHPLTSERIADIQARIRDVPYRQHVDNLEFQLIRARARVLQDGSTQGLAEATAAFESQQKSQNRQQQVGAQYGLAFVALKRDQLPQAQAMLDRARATLRRTEGAFSTGQAGSDGAAVFAALALDIKLAPGQSAAVKLQGLKDAELAHQQFPLARGLACQYADALILNGKPDEATRFLREQVLQYREEPKLHELLSKAYAAQGKQALQHIALAEQYALSGGKQAALDQLAIARKAGDASFYDMALIDARERELKTLRLEEIKEAKKAGRPDEGR
ncbi:M48 family metalloprotease [Massilia sp. TWP1-3-3]|uniref:M48 family metalloprotease n=1 Tax=Massilia sp. TWP1-3-3 TaxID=2804573 RepID=UPI003CEF0C8F